VIQKRFTGFARLLRSLRFRKRGISNALFIL